MVTISRARLTDRQDMINLLTTPVNGSSPLDELKADWGSAVSFNLTQWADLIADGQMQVAVARDTALRGFIVFSYVARHALPVSDDGWRCDLIVTDKSLTVVNRLAVASRMIGVSSGVAAVSFGDPYIFGDIKTPGNLDTYCSTRLAFFPVTVGSVSCHRYYGHASQLAQVFT